MADLYFYNKRFEVGTEGDTTGYVVGELGLINFATFTVVPEYEEGEVMKNYASIEKAGASIRDYRIGLTSEGPMIVVGCGVEIAGIAQAGGAAVLIMRAWARLGASPEGNGNITKTLDVNTAKTYIDTEIVFWGTK